MSLKLNSVSGGSVTLQEPSTAGNFTLNLPAADATIVAAAPGTSGNVLTSNGTTWTSAAPAAPTTQQVLDATAGATAGGVGTYSYAYVASGAEVTLGSTFAGSGLRSINAVQFLTGTWRAMSIANSGGYQGVWLRIS